MVMKLQISRKYDAWIFEADARPWEPATWKRVAGVLAGIFDGEVKTAVRTGAKLGKLGWNDHAKWTTRAANFSHAEFWSPSWNDFGRTGRPPDAFLQFVNEEGRSFTLLAVALDPGDQSLAARQLAAVLKASRVMHKKTAWARKEGVAFTNSLQDFLSTTERDEKHGGLRLTATWKPW